MRPFAPPSHATGALSVVLLLVSGACESMELAPGEVNDIYVVAERGVWEQVRDTLGAALQPTVLTVTEELAFQVVDQDPTEPEWERLKKFKQLLLIGKADDFWIRPALERSEWTSDTAPGLFAVQDVWSRNQLVTVLLLSSDEPGQVVERLGELNRHYEELFREWALARMFVSGRDSALADTLSREHGFTLLLPDVYQWSLRDSTYVFRNDNPSPDELIRQVTVSWLSPLPSDLDSLFAVEPVVSWRQAVAERTVATGQVVDTGRVRVGSAEYGAHRAFELQAVWQNPPSANWPAAGPFIARVVACEEQDRLYLLDAWLYAPGRDKYEYMIQLNTVLDSFRCG